MHRRNFILIIFLLLSVLFSSCERPKYSSEKFTPYNEVLKAYYDALLYRWDIEKVNENRLTPVVIDYHDEENNLSKMGYCFMDLNGDGSNELLIGVMPDGDFASPVIYDFYTVKDGKAHQVDRGWYEYYFCILNINEMYRLERHVSAGKIESYDYYILENGDLKHEQSVVMNVFEDENNPWFLADNDELNLTDEMKISKEKYFELVNAYVGKDITPNYISFETLE